MTLRMSYAREAVWLNVTWAQNVNVAHCFANFDIHSHLKMFNDEHKKKKVSLLFVNIECIMIHHWLQYFLFT